MVLAGYSKKKSIRYFKVKLKQNNRTDFPYAWAVIQCDFGNFYYEREQGNKAENIEKAISCYKSALKVHNCKRYPDDWIVLQQNLGNAYGKRISGKKSENLEKSINYYQAALKYMDNTKYPQEWVDINNDIGVSFMRRIEGKKEENLEQAIDYLKNALDSCSYSKFPYKFATTQKNLGNCFFNRIKGEKSSNQKKAIYYYESALEIQGIKKYTQSWAEIHDVLGTIYHQIDYGEKQENLEKSVEHYKLALDWYDPKEYPQDWARLNSNLGIIFLNLKKGNIAENTEKSISYQKLASELFLKNKENHKWAEVQRNLADAYSERLLGERAVNLEQAIEYLQAASNVIKREEKPLEWADMQNRLGITHFYRIEGEKFQNLEKAIQYYSEALTALDANVNLHQWANVQNNLANSYINRIFGDKTENIEKAIIAYNNALKFYSIQTSLEKEGGIKEGELLNNLSLAYLHRINGNRAENIELSIQISLRAKDIFSSENSPKEWGQTMNTLGTLYRERINGEKEKNLELSINYLLSGLKVCEYHDFPEIYLKCQMNLGLAYQNSKQFYEAYKAFDLLIEKIENQRDEIVYGSGLENNKQKLAEEWNAAYCRIIEVCLELKKYTEAIEYIERSKNRNLIERILERDSELLFSPEVISQLNKLQDEIVEKQSELQNGYADDPTTLAENLRELRYQCKKLKDSCLPIGFSFQYEKFQQQLDNQTAVVEFFLTGRKLIAFIFTGATQSPIPWEFEPIYLSKLQKWLNSYFRAYSSHRNHWIRRLNTRLSLLAKILEIDKIVELIPKECQSLVFIPHTVLHILPLHALPLGSKHKESPSQFLIDYFPKGISYAPSCQLLQLTKKVEKPYFTNLVAIQNPTEDLNYADLEVQAIKHYFDSANIFEKSNATKEAINTQVLEDAHCLHFSCHGYFNPNLGQVRQSALILANATAKDVLINNSESEEVIAIDLNKCLTVDDVFDLKLDLCRLVVLSACETGIIDFRNISDEYVGLASGFLYAGSPSLVSSLWTVDDVSTAFLFIKFYENVSDYLKIHDKLDETSIANILRKAQIWLRDLDRIQGNKFLAQIDAHIESLFLNKPRSAKAFKTIAFKRINGNTNYPFANPFYWASFTAIGF